MKCSEIYPKLVDDLMSMRGVESDYKPEWDWTRFMIRGKMFAAICADGTDDALLNIKAQPDYNDTIRRLHEDINEGYYMIRSTGTA